MTDPSPSVARGSEPSAALLASDQGAESASVACCEYGPVGHTQQQHHDASPCYDADCPFEHPHGGPFPHPEDDRG